MKPATPLPPVFIARDPYSYLRIANSCILDRDYEHPTAQEYVDRANDYPKLQAERDKLLREVKRLKLSLEDAAQGFGLAYSAVSVHHDDEALLHLGAHEARVRKVLSELSE